MSFILSHKRQFLAFMLSVVLSVVLVALVVSGATYVDTDSVGIATSSPGAALGVKGAALVDGFLGATYLRATSTGSVIGPDATSTALSLAVGGYGYVKGDWNVAGTTTLSSAIATSTLGVGTSTPEAQFGLIGRMLVYNDGATSTFFGGIHVKDIGGLTTNSGLTVAGGELRSAGRLEILSTATSTFRGGVNISADSLVIDYSTGNIGVATSSYPTIINSADTSTGLRPRMVIGGGTASTSVFVAGGAEVGSAIILKDSDGNGCTMITVLNGALSSGDVGCPRN
jgi:hypothetical protein